MALTVAVCKFMLILFFSDFEVVDKQYQHQYEGAQVGDVDCFTAVSADRNMLTVVFFGRNSTTFATPLRRMSQTRWQ